MDDSRETHIQRSYNQNYRKPKTENVERRGKKQLITYKEYSIQLATDISRETLYDRRLWDNIFKVNKEKMSTEDYICGKISFKTNEEFKTSQIKIN